LHRQKPLPQLLKPLLPLKKLLKQPTVGEIKGMNHLLQGIESEADDLILDILGDLYSGRHAPTKVVAMKDLYELLEKVVDRCRDASGLIVRVVLKRG